MTNKEKLSKAKQLLNEVAENWDEKEVKEYGSDISFDELVNEINTIRLK